MSFLDNLENNLKTLEGREEGGADDRARRDADLKDARAAAPWSDKLKSSEWTKTLMSLATRAGHQRRFKVNLIWIGTTLRLEAKGLRVELRPTAKGVRCVFLRGHSAVAEEILNLEGDPSGLVQRWMEMLDSEPVPTYPSEPDEVEE